MLELSPLRHVRARMAHAVVWSRPTSAGKTEGVSFLIEGQPNARGRRGCNANGAVSSRLVRPKGICHERAIRQLWSWAGGSGWAALDAPSQAAALERGVRIQGNGDGEPANRAVECAADM